MKKAQIPQNELKRLEALRALKILDTAKEERFDRITRLASRIFQVPVAIVSLVDENRVWCKSTHGLSLNEVPRDMSFCGHAINYNNFFIVHDTHLDDRFHDHPFVINPPNIRFYAASPITVNFDLRLGTLCLLDYKPRVFNDEEKIILQDLTRLAENEISALQHSTLYELTQISDRRGFNLLAPYALSWCKREALPACIVVFDLDNFKSINDTFGHLEGDKALIVFSSILRRVLRNSDVFARIGGDEFVAILTDTQCIDVQLVMTRLRAHIIEFNQRNPNNYQLSFSYGCHDLTAEQTINLSDSLAAADRQMYKNKAAKKRLY
ncbi:sensor domain-containing diguanylate cyclase [Gayadomonas joobiniege]|uniref:GGDEF domain-containing protein n=1 Tax=Gayadomonas joobiniege TaxID=1234606 RepID=UPI00037544EF|nr:sensor domain-containing diguanylate cyclase [Gayadomonas joobiniege]